MKVNGLYEKHIRHLVLNAKDLPRHLAVDRALKTGSSVGNATSLALLRHSLAFTSIRRAGQRISAADRDMTLHPKEVQRGCAQCERSDSCGTLTSFLPPSCSASCNDTRFLLPIRARC